jgi:hypothetical protein
MKTVFTGDLRITGGVRYDVIGITSHHPLQYNIMDENGNNLSKRL